jgi:replication factor A1
MDEDLRAHVDDIAKALGNKVDRDRIAKELDNYIRVYRVNIDDAKRSIVRKFGGTAMRFAVGVDKKLSGLKGGEMNVNLLCRVVSVNAKTIDSNGTKKEIMYGILGDDTGTTPFTAWETENLELEKGDVIRIENAYTKEWMGRVQVYFGSRISITQMPKESLPYPQSAVSKIGELEDGQRNVSVVGRILSIEKREVTVDGKQKFVFSGIIGDATGRVGFSAWSDFGLKDDEVVKIDNAYIKSWRGIPQLTFDDKATVERVDEELPSKKDIMRGGRVRIGDTDGGVDIVVEGVVVDVKPGSGLIYRCPECNRAVKKGECSIHGNVDAQPDLRIKAIVDDGTGAVNALVGRELTEKILGKDLNKSLEETRNSPNPELIKDELFDRLVSRPMMFRGNILKDDFGLTMIVNSVESIKSDLRQEAKDLLDGLEV